MKVMTEASRWSLASVATLRLLVVPLMLASGAGAEVRQAPGTAVFAGMVGVTLFGLFLTPVFYVALRKLVTRGERTSQVQEGYQA
nr:efflux RND transporter permease subunit [Halomonas huangheensis]